MKKLFKTSLIILFFSLMVSSSSVFASGKMEVSIGQTVQLTAESDLFAPTYKWVVQRENEILSTQTSKNLNYTFPFQGEYKINLTVTTDDEVENTVIYVLAGDRFPRPFSPQVPDSDSESSSLSLNLNLETLPALNNQNQVQLLGDGRLQFSTLGSTGNILEYRIDKNIFVDSDGNGVANDDIDNAADDSYLTGGTWLTSYTQDESPQIAAQVTLVDQEGKKISEQIDILFGNPNKAGDLVAILNTLPAADPQTGNVKVYQDPHLVSFYSRGSTGNILEYRIDKNIFEDSDGDGDPANDIDNINDASFRTGDVFEISYPKTDSQIIAQLIIVGEGGRGSRVQRGIVFGDAPVVSDLGEPTEEGGIQLTADKNLVFAGDPVAFEVQGLSLALSEYIFNWDFDGDGEIDKEIEANNTVEHIFEAPGLFPVTVTIADKQGNSADRKVDLIVKEEVVTRANFEYEVTQNKVSFTNLSTANSNLANQTLQYQWNFGDTDPEGYEAQRDQIAIENPTYTYKNQGTYIVSLTVTDANEVIDTKISEIQIIEGGLIITDSGDTASEADSDQSADSGGGGSVILTVLKFILYAILVILGLGVLIVLGFMVFLKIQHPDLTFEELVDEFKVKVLTMIGAHEEIRPTSGNSSDLPKPPSSVSPEMPEENLTPPPSAVNQNTISNVELEGDSEVQDETVLPEEDSVEVQLPPEEQGPMPSWLQNKEVVEGEVDESESDSAQDEQIESGDDLPSNDFQSVDEDDEDDFSDDSDQITADDFDFSDDEGLGDDDFNDNADSEDSFSDEDFTDDSDLEENYDSDESLDDFTDDDFSEDVDSETSDDDLVSNESTNESAEDALQGSGEVPLEENEKNKK